MSILFDAVLAVGSFVAGSFIGYAAIVAYIKKEIAKIKADTEAILKKDEVAVYSKVKKVL